VVDEMDDKAESGEALAQDFCAHRWELKQIYDVSVFGKKGDLARIDTREKHICFTCGQKRDRLLRMDHLGKLVL
jgi:hypothetical protein